MLTKHKIRPLPQAQLSFLRPGLRYVVLDEEDNIIEGPFRTLGGAQGDLDYLQSTTDQTLRISDLQDTDVWDVEQVEVHGFATGTNVMDRFTLKGSRKASRSWLQRLLRR